MKDFFKKKFANPRTRVWLSILGIIVIVALVIIGVLLFKELRKKAAYAKAEKTINVAGTVEPANTVNLGFETGGRVVKVTKVIGDRVAAGEIIAEVDNANLRAELTAAEASVSAQKVKITQLQSGTDTLAVNVAQAQVLKDTDAVTDDSNDLLAVLAEDYSVADDAIHDKVDDFFTNPYTANPQLAFTDTDPSASTIESGRVEVENRLTDLRTLTAATTTADISDTSDSVKDDLAEIKLFLDNVALTINALAPNTSGVPQASIDEWKSDLSTARTNVDDSITATLAADDKLQSAGDTLTVDQQELTAAQNADVSTEIASEKATLAEDEALVDKINAELAATYIISPIDGLVTQQDARLGQIAPANVNLVSIESDSKYQIAAVVPDNDAGRIAVGQSADVRLDAYGSNVVFEAVVVGIDPTDVNGEETTTLQFEASDDRIKSGMAGSIVIYNAGAHAAAASTTAGNKL